MQNNIKIFGTLVVVTFLLIVGIVMRYTAAADDVLVSTSAEITNTAPVVDSVSIATAAYAADDLTSTGILPNVGADRIIHINGVISDQNGESDISSSTVNLVFRKTSGSNACTDDKNDCYRIAACATNYATGDDTQISYNCELPISYWIDSTDNSSVFASDSWTAYVEASDLASTTANRSATIEVNSLLALDIPLTIDYGTRSLGEQSSSTTNIPTTFIQRGNIGADVALSGADMNCDGLGKILVDSQRYTFTDIDYASSTEALSVATVRSNIGVTPRTNETAELQKQLFWNIAIPASGVRGTCTGANTISITAAPLTVQYEGGPYDAAGTNRNNGGYYRTVQIGTQTWMKDNLNVGTMLATLATEPADNQIVEKWCHGASDESTNSVSANCDTYGGLYKWDEAMQYVTTEGAQGICPTGFHIPTDAEFKTLEIFLGMTSADANADALGWDRGTNQGIKIGPGGSSGFDAGYAGNRNAENMVFRGMSYSVGMWSSTEFDASIAWRRHLHTQIKPGGIFRNAIDKNFGFAIRCLKN